MFESQVSDHIAAGRLLRVLETAARLIRGITSTIQAGDSTPRLSQPLVEALRYRG